MIDSQQSFQHKPNPLWLKETTVGGGLEPCPFCSIPRCQRSDYIRCAKCGINWTAGEDLSHDPRVERRAAFMASATAPPPS